MAVSLARSDAMEALALQADADLQSATPQEVLAWGVDEFGDDLCVASSMGDTVLVHMAARVRPGIPVLFLDTGYHFAETIGTRDAVAAAYDVRVVDVRPELTVAEQDAKHGADLFARDPDACCWIRKVQPLARGLEPFAAWASGIRRDESPSRRHIPVVGWDAARRVVKLNPLATWTQRQVDDYIAEHGVLVNPLLSEGYSSIGCAPCTERVSAGQDARAGRWTGTGKTECGIHLQAKDSSTCA